MDYIVLFTAEWLGVNSTGFQKNKTSQPSSPQIYHPSPTGFHNWLDGDPFTMLVRAECVHTNVVRALADVVATILFIILSFFFLSSFHLLFSQNGFAYNFGFGYAFLSNKNIRFIILKNGGGALPSPPKSSFLG